MTALQQYLNEHNMHSFEGEDGCKKLETICKELGYTESGFRFGDPIGQFLCDNPGAISAIVEWIDENFGDSTAFGDVEDDGE